jgi:secreted trypsin-like serine protease
MLFLVIYFLLQISFSSTESITYSCSSNSTCGCSLEPAVLTKIIGGEEAKANTWGWAVSIRSRNSHRCGGSLISPELVITAAHCFGSDDPISRLSVTAGSEYLSNIKQQRSISEIFIHRDYNYETETYVNDIAVIHLSSPFDMNDSSLTLICLSAEITANKINTDVVAIGWGVVSTRDESSSNILQQVTLTTIENTDKTCSQSIHDEKVQFCAGVSGGGKGIKNKKNSLY